MKLPEFLVEEAGPALLRAAQPSADAAEKRSGKVRGKRRGPQSSQPFNLFAQTFVQPARPERHISLFSGHLARKIESRQ